MAKRTKTELKSQSVATFFDNDTGEIQPAGHRSFNEDMIDSMATADQGTAADSAIQSATLGGVAVPKSGTALQIPAYTPTGPTKCTIPGFGTNIYYTVIGNLLLLCGTAGDQDLVSSLTITNLPTSLMSKTLLTTISSAHFNGGIDNIDKPMVVTIAKSGANLVLTFPQSFGDDKSIIIPAMLIAFS